MEGEEGEGERQGGLGGLGPLRYLGQGATMGLQPGNMRRDLPSIHLLGAGENATGALITRL